MKRDDAVLAGAILVLLLLALAFAGAPRRQQIGPLPLREDPAILRLDEGMFIHINRADEEMLTSLDGVGPVLARRILAARQKNGPFAGPEDVDAIKGVGPHIMESIHSRVVFLP